ncbi:MAG: DUF4998 domain-containing protein [Bacteroidales bacterium]|nr:DUF4998 domain-containing protein [Bacteroidales bacterium]
MKNLRVKWLKIMAVALCSFFVAGASSCKDMNDVHQEYVRTGIYPAKAVDVVSVPGKNRIKIAWAAGADKSLTGARIFWQNYTESYETDILPNMDSVRCIIGPLAEGNYSFIIHTYDDKGNRSVPVEVNGRVYGDQYISTLLPRDIASLNSAGNTYRIDWQPASDTTMLHTTVTYTDHGNAAHPVERSLRVSNDAMQTILTGVKAGESFFVASTFLPGLDVVISPRRQYETEEVPSGDQIEDVSGDRIPVFAQFGVPLQASTPAMYREMADAGFTHNWGAMQGQTYNATDFTTMLDAAQGTGIKQYLMASQYSGTLEDMVTKFKDHPALGGYFLWDEPHVSNFVTVANWMTRIEALDPVHPCYVVLFPNYANAVQLGTGVNAEVICTKAEYEAYVRQYMQMVSPPFLCFDHFGVRENNGRRTVWERYYENLEIIADEAKKANIPFWGYALSSSIAGFPIPTLADLRLQMYSNLAYGAQGLNYYAYWNGGAQPPVADGVKTPTYYVVQEMNREIKTLSKVFLNAKVVLLGHTGTPPPSCSALATAQLPAVIKSIETNGGDALVSVLEKGNDHFLVVVNRDINVNLQVKVEGTAALRRVRKDGSIVIADSRTHTVTPGDVLIFFWK